MIAYIYIYISTSSTSSGSTVAGLRDFFALLLHTVCLFNLAFHVDILLWMHVSPILLGHATWNCVDWHLFIDSWQVQQLPHLYLLLFCQELTTVTHCCLVLLMV